jgi:hypothetical protein
MGPDQLAQIIEQFEDGKRLLRRPVVGEMIDEAGLEGGSGHDFVLRRLAARAAARSWASLWR